MDISVYCACLLTVYLGHYDWLPIWTNSHHEQTELLIILWYAAQEHHHIFNFENKLKINQSFYVSRKKLPTSSQCVVIIARGDLIWGYVMPVQ